MAKSREYKGYIFEDNGHGDLYNGEVDKFLIFRPYPMMVETIIHKDGSVTMNQNKFKENTDKNKGVYEEGYETNDDGSVFVKAEDVDEKIKEESEDNKSTASEDEISDDYKVGNLAQQEKWNSYFTLESQLGDMEAAQEYLDADDMTQYIKDEPYGHKIDNIRWVLDDDQSGHVEITTNEHLTEEETEELQDWIDGQNSDGLGEGFEQQDFANAYYNPDTGDGPYTYQEAEQEIADMIDSVDISDFIDYVDESEIEAAVDTYMEDNGLYQQFIEEHQDEAYDAIIEFCDPSEVENAYAEVKGEEITEDEMDNLYDIIRSDSDLLEDVGNNLLQNLADYEMADFVAGLDGGDEFREQCKDDMLSDDPEGYISDDALYEAREAYANDHYNTNIDEWGTMASMRRSVDGLQLETPPIEEDKLAEGEFKVSPGVMMDMLANGAKVINDDEAEDLLNEIRSNTDEQSYEEIANEYRRGDSDINDLREQLKTLQASNNDQATFEASDFVKDNLSDEFGADWREVNEEDLREAVQHYVNVYNDANVQPEYKNEEFYGREANADKVYDYIMNGTTELRGTPTQVNSNLKADDISTIASAFNDINDKHGYAIDKAAEVLNQEGLRDVYHITAGNVGSNKAEIEFEDGSKITFGEDGATISGANLNSYDMQVYQRAAKAYENNLKNDHSFDFGNNAWHLNPDDYDEPKEFIDKINEHNDRALASKDYSKTLDATRKEIQSYLDLPENQRIDEFGDRDDLYKYINSNYYNVGKSDFDRIYNEEFANKAYDDHLNDEFDWRFNSNKTDFEREVAFNKAQRGMSEEDAIKAANNSMSRSSRNQELYNNIDNAYKSTKSTGFMKDYNEGNISYDELKNEHFDGKDTYLRDYLQANLEDKNGYQINANNTIKNANDKARIKDYTDDTAGFYSGHEINKGLNSDDEFRYERARANADDLEKLITPKLQEATRVFTKIPVEDLEGKSTGDKIHINGFLSTSLHDNTNENYSGINSDVVEVIAPAGKEALYIAELSKHPLEQELLFKTNQDLDIIAKKNGRYIARML